MAKVIFVCPFCGQELEGDESLQGTDSQCPKCHGDIVLERKKISVPRPQAMTAPPVPKPQSCTDETPSAPDKASKKKKKSPKPTKPSLTTEQIIFGDVPAKERSYLANFLYYYGVVSFYIAIGTVPLVFVIGCLTGEIKEYLVVGALFFAFVFFVNIHFCYGLAQFVQQVSNMCRDVAQIKAERTK